MISITREDVIGKEFVYESKYGGFVEGVVADYTLWTACKYAGTPEDPIRVYREEISVISDRGNLYNINEIYFKCGE